MPKGMHKISQPQLPIITITGVIIWGIIGRYGWQIQKRRFNIRSIIPAACHGLQLPATDELSKSITVYSAAKETTKGLNKEKK